jgi:hypothetical protein
MTIHALTQNTPAQECQRTSRLASDQIRMIEEALEDVGEFGEVRLVVEKGKLRFLVVQRSLDILKECNGKVVR